MTLTIPERDFLVEVIDYCVDYGDHDTLNHQLIQELLRKLAMIKKQPNLAPNEGYSIAEAIEVLYKAVLRRKSMGNCPASLTELTNNVAKEVIQRLERDL
jgi:hypothetical protein